MRRIQVCVLTFLLAFAIHEVSAQDDEEHGIHYTGDEHEDSENWEHPEDPELSIVDVYHMHGKVDTDQSGMISREELLAYFHKAHKEGRLADEALEEMERIDANHDGDVDLTELKDAYHSFEPQGDPEVVAEAEKAFNEDKLKFTAADADESGELNFDEFMSFHFSDERVQEAEAKPRWEEFNKNKDGGLSFHEFEDLGKDLEGDNFTSQAAAAFEFLDVDGNGLLSLEEYIPWELGHFDRDKAITKLMHAADTNGDKELAVDELMAIEKDIIHHQEEHYAIRELVEFSKMEEDKKNAHKDEL